MMKQIAFLMVALSFAAFSHAQEGGIVYRDFDPDLYVEGVVYPYPPDTIKVDIDQDGTTDFEVFVKYKSPEGLLAAYRTAQPWQYRFHYLEADTLVPNDGSDGNNLRWRTSPAPSIITYEGIDGSFTNPKPLLLGFRKQVGDDKYHAWMRMTVRCVTGGINVPGYGVRAYVEDIAYCTIPDYPLQWGQTEFWGVGEAGDTVFAEVHPNPTSGLLSIEGTSLEKAEVRNTLGQSVATAKGHGGRLTVDISGLPAGVYFVSVADQNGRKCVRKVVKE